MKVLEGRNALVTGASGGIGTHIARALARVGMNVVLSGRRADALELVAAELRSCGVRAVAVTADLRDPVEAEALIERSSTSLAPLHVLVNNAGIELTAAFTRYTREELISVVNVNLLPPLLMTHRVLPGMLDRGHGHVVFIASVAGKIGAAYQEPYVATKAGLIALTQSLRAEYLNHPVGFSVVCPGFVAGDGMYQRMADAGLKSNRLMGTTTVDRVASTVVDVIRRDRPEAIVSGTPLRPALALSQLAPRQRASRASDWLDRALPACGGLPRTRLRAGRARPHRVGTDDPLTSTG